MKNIAKKEKNHSKLLKAYDNNAQISDMNLGNKFIEFENSRLDESKTLLYEINVKPSRFKRYSRGQIVKVKFGINIGSEFSGDHYAVVISKQDTMYNPVLHVIPLTSKKHYYNIKLGNILYSNEHINILNDLLENEENIKNTKKIKKCIKYYENRKDKVSYACIKHLKTISKLSICRPINEYDYLPKVKISSDLLRKIDKEIIKEYTVL